LEKKKRQNTKPPEFETPAEKLNCTVQQKCGFFGAQRVLSYQGIISSCRRNWLGKKLVKHIVDLLDVSLRNQFCRGCKEVLKII